jgi:hypothetical protein
MNHKRRRPKNARAGCLMCKPHKANGAKNRDRSSVVRRTQRGRDERAGLEESMENIRREVDAGG